MGKIRLIIFGLLMTLSSLSFAQKDRYVVFFEDKAQSPFSIDQPLAYLSQRAIDRRERQQITILENDLPVNPQYVSQVSEIGAETYFTSRWMNCLLVEATEDQITEITGLPIVSSVELVAPGEQLNPFVDNVPELGPFLSPAESDLSTQFQLNMLKADVMHSDGFTGNGLMIAVLDGGFIGTNQSMAFQHLENEGKLLATKDFTLNQSDVFRSVSHGTSVLSCIAAKYGEQVVGTAYNAEVALFITEDDASEFRIEEYNWLFAAEVADSMGVDVINSSIGYRTFDDSSMDYDFDELDGATSVIARANDLAFSKGMIVVTSAGNTSSNLTSPGDAFNSLTVGSVDSDGTKSTFSAFFDSSDGRTKPEVVALGRSTVTIGRTGDIGTTSGTSFSSPLIAGFVAGIWESKPEATNREIVELIKMSGSQADDITDLLGYGIPNYLVLSNQVVTSTSESESFDLGLDIYPNPVDQGVLTVSSRVGTSIKIFIRDLTGKLLDIYELESSGKNNLDITHLPQATYLISISSQEDFLTKKIVKR